MILKDDKLVAHHARLGDFTAALKGKNTLEIPSIGSVNIIRNTENMITGIRISNGRAKNVWFEKQ
jgi:hypothetical protein